MKLTLNITEVQEAVSAFIVANGFPVDMENAIITITDNGADVSFEKVEETQSKPVRKAKKPTKEKVEEPVETVEDPIEETVSQSPIEDVPTTDLVIEELDKDDAVTNEEVSGNDFSLFG